ncbi:MAG: hypothetical protein WC712_02820 [Candidatus Brocadiia bacterium]
MKNTITVLLAMAFISLSFCGTACAEQKVIASMDLAISVMGDSSSTVTMKFSALADYTQTKGMYASNPMLLVRQLVGNRGKSQFVNPRVSFDDPAMTLTVTATELAAAKNKGDSWTLDAQDARLRIQQGNMFMFDLDVPLQNGIGETAGFFTVAVKLTVPASAKEATFNAARKRVEYKLDPSSNAMRFVWIGLAAIFLVLAVGMSFLPGMTKPAAAAPGAAPPAPSGPTQ